MRFKTQLQYRRYGCLNGWYQQLSSASHVILRHNVLFYLLYFPSGDSSHADVNTYNMWESFT